MHDANALGRGLESDPIQPVRLYETRLRHKLRGDAARSNSCELPHPARILLRSAVQRGRVAGRIQAVPAHTKATAKATAKTDMLVILH